MDFMSDAARNPRPYNPKAFLRIDNPTDSCDEGISIHSRHLDQKLTLEESKAIYAFLEKHKIPQEKSDGVVLSFEGVSNTVEVLTDRYSTNFSVSKEDLKRECPVLYDHLDRILGDVARRMAY